MPTLQKNNFGELYTRASCEDGFSTIHFTDDSLTFFLKQKLEVSFHTIGAQPLSDGNTFTKRYLQVSLQKQNVLFVVSLVIFIKMNLAVEYILMR